MFFCVNTQKKARSDACCRENSILKNWSEKKDNGRVKVITGLRGCGKSFLLFKICRNYLLDHGVDQSQVIVIALDVLENAKYRNPFELDKYIRDRMTDNGKRYCIFIDEIQNVSEIDNPYVDVGVVEKNGKDSSGRSLNH